jgi:hypothetical protein
MEIDGPTATIIAASVALMLAIMGFIGVVNSRLGKLEAGQQALSEKVDTHHSENLRMHKETRAENIRMHEVTQAQNIRMHEEARAENIRMHEETRAENARMHEETRAENVRMYSEARAEYIRMHDQSRAENVRMHEETRADIRRVLDALVTHSHDADGPVFFRIPPGTDPEN